MDTIWDALRIALAFGAGIFLGWASWAPRSRSSHLCLHINGAHRCTCKRWGDHSHMKHPADLTADLYDYNKEAR